MWDRRTNATTIHTQSEHMLLKQQVIKDRRMVRVHDEYMRYHAPTGRWTHEMRRIMSGSVKRTCTHVQVVPF